jgi:transposase-like protein
MSSDVTQALVKLVENQGNVAATARELEVSEHTLRKWKNDTYAEQYHQLEVRHGDTLEQVAVQQARENIRRAGKIEKDLLERASEITDTRMVPQALKAVSDSKAKNVDKLLALTGRPKTDEKPAAEGFMQLLEGMARKGYLRINVSTPEVTEGTAEEDEPPAA